MSCITVERKYNEKLLKAFLRDGKIELKMNCIKEISTRVLWIIKLIINEYH